MHCNASDYYDRCNAYNELVCVYVLKIDFAWTILIVINSL